MVENSVFHSSPNRVVEKILVCGEVPHEAGERNNELDEGHLEAVDPDDPEELEPEGVLQYGVELDLGHRRGVVLVLQSA